MKKNYSEDDPFERMRSGELFLPQHPEYGLAYENAQTLLNELNSLQGNQHELIQHVLSRLIGKLGENAIIKPSFSCDYGFNIQLGARTFINSECLFLDCNIISIGEDVQVGPGVHIYTATHPLEANLRRDGLESTFPVKIGDGVWIGGRSVLCPGVSIGQNTVIGAGSVVNKDIPANVLAVGNPCRIIRYL